MEMACRVTKSGRTLMVSETEDRSAVRVTFTQNGTETQTLFIPASEWRAFRRALSQLRVIAAAALLLLAVRAPAQTEIQQPLGQDFTTRWFPNGTSETCWVQNLGAGGSAIVCPRPEPDGENVIAPLPTPASVLP